MMSRYFKILFAALGVLFLFYPVSAQSVLIDSFPGWISNSIDGSSILKWGDIDNDGDLDLIGCNNFDSRVYTYLNNAGIPDKQVSWLYEETQFTAGFSSLLCGDINNDTYLDIIAGGRLLLNNFGTMSSVPVCTIDVRNPALGDFDNDGDLDLAAVFYNEKDLIILMKTAYWMTRPTGIQSKKIILIK